MDNIKSLIQRHNKSNLNFYNNRLKKKTTPCNCRVKATCLLGNKCLTENVIYEATLTSKNEEKIDIKII